MTCSKIWMILTFLRSPNKYYSFEHFSNDFRLLRILLKIYLVSLLRILTKFLIRIRWFGQQPTYTRKTKIDWHWHFDITTLTWQCVFMSMSAMYQLQVSSISVGSGYWSFEFKLFNFVRRFFLWSALTEVRDTNV